MKHARHNLGHKICECGCVFNGGSFSKTVSCALFLSSNMHGFWESQCETWPILMQPTPSSFLIFLNVYLFSRQRETERAWGRGRERRRYRIWNKLQAPSCQHRARRGARTQEPWDHNLTRSRTLNRLSHPGAPTYTVFLLAWQKDAVACGFCTKSHILAWQRE